ncbi:MAG: 2Fe-2S iron-sulfur cluster binding domain-containing protein [Acidobacteriaceae bacterium]|nr:2Fe-2S iron-sulfur cluster binding domain-containing protein [Acidobacteriaceae bacterium]MBV9294735.1 2Fe-2S iron-sulfur cluster binding domain-containing protein [Acidobacteriaceae bacterium]
MAAFPLFMPILWPRPFIVTFCEHQSIRAISSGGGNTIRMDSPLAAHSVTLHVNGREHKLQLEARVSLLDALREHIGLTGTKKGCNQGACGACTVLVNGERINSCFALAVQYDGMKITTIEGLADANGLHPLQQAFVKHDGFQCGYCTPGQICSAAAMIEEFRGGAPSAVTELEAKDIEFSDLEIQERMSGNLCRCGAYVGINEAIRDAFEVLSR